MKHSSFLDEKSYGINNSKFFILRKFRHLLTDSSATNYFVYYSGRGAGKSENIAACLIILSALNPHRVLCCREFQSSITESVKAMLEQKIGELNLWHLFRSTHDKIECINGSEFIFKGLRNMNVGNIKSIAGVSITWIEEAEFLSNQSYEILIPSVTRVRHPRIIFSFNPRYETDVVYQKFVVNKPPPRSRVVYLTQADNPFFKGSNLEIQMLHDKETLGKAEYEHKWEGKIITKADNALFDIDMVRQSHIADYPSNVYRIVIGIDPATTAKEYSNDTGIVVCAALEDGTYCVLENASGKLTPIDMANAVYNLYVKYNADAIIVETNQGGSYIKATLLEKYAFFNIKEIRAVSDKVNRAMPVAAMVSVGKIKFLYNKFSMDKILELEDEMKHLTTQGFIGPKHKSPDALDAFVWAIYELASLKENEQAATIYNDLYFQYNNLYCFHSGIKQIYAVMRAEYTICCIYQTIETQDLKKAILIEDCFAVKTIEFNENDYPEIFSIHLPEVAPFIEQQNNKYSFYEPLAKNSKDLDELVLSALPVIKSNKIMIKGDVPTRKYGNEFGDLLRIRLFKFKLETDNFDPFVELICMLATNF